MRFIFMTITEKNNDDANLLGAQMRAHTQGRFSCCALVHLFHNNVLVAICIVIYKSNRALKLETMKYHLVVGSLLTLLVILHRRIRTGVFNERRHI